MSTKGTLRVTIDVEGHAGLLLLDEEVEFGIGRDERGRAEGKRQIALLQDLIDKMEAALLKTFGPEVQ